MSVPSTQPLPEVRLRAMEPEDLDLIYAMENDEDQWPAGRTNVPYSRYVLHDYIASATNDIYADGQVRMVIEAADGKVVGLVDLVDFSAQHLRAEISIVVLRDCRRQGYAAAALRKVASYALRILHLHQLYAVVGEGNAASLALLTGCGYRVSGELDEWLYDGRAYGKAKVLQLFL